MAEYRALQKCGNTLTDLLQHHVVTTSTSLLAKGLLTDDLHSWVLTASGVSNKEKAARILSAVVDQVKHSPLSYHDFIDVLKKESFLEDAVKLLSLEFLGMVYDTICSYWCNVRGV